jgi:hypothetical protein
LIRDWVNDEVYSFGYKGGQEYLEEAVFKIKPKQVENMKRLRKFIKDSFESIKCFLMPHPGSIVAGKGKFNGNWGVIDKPFVDHLKVLVPSILAPENLSVKKIAGEEMTGEKLYWHMQFYLKLFQSSKFPTAKSIYDSTVAKFLQDLVSQCADMYKGMMVNGTATIETHSDFDILHFNSKNKAIDVYNKEKKIGSKESITFYRNALISEIGKIQAEQNHTIYLKIENNMKDREIEAQKNETLREMRKVEELRKAQEVAELKANEALIEIQKNTKRIEEKNKEIADLENSLKDQKAKIEEAMRKQAEQVDEIKAQHTKEITDIKGELLKKDRVIEENQRQFTVLQGQVRRGHNAGREMRPTIWVPLVAFFISTFFLKIYKHSV